MKREKYARMKVLQYTYEGLMAAHRAAILAALDKVFKENPLPENWRILIRESQLELHENIPPGEPTSGKIFTYGKSEPQDTNIWASRQPDEAPDFVKAAYDKINKVFQEVLKQNPPPNRPPALKAKPSRQ